MSNAPFFPEEMTPIPGNSSGPLQGLTFAAKDLFDLQGMVTGAGNPTWADQQQPAENHASAVQKLLDAGATVTGKAISSEFAYSLYGENGHYGTPVNPASPDRVPGGSSSGSASAVAAGIVDFALGTDTGGSVRVPASFCGTLGIRPTQGVISLEGVWPLAPMFDTVGWFAKLPEVFKNVGKVLLPEQPPQEISTLYYAEDLLNHQLLHPAHTKVFTQLISQYDLQPLTLFEDGIDEWINVYLVLLSAQLQESHGTWIREHLDAFNGVTRKRMERSLAVSTPEKAWAKWKVGDLRKEGNAKVPEGAVVFLPTTAGPAPMLNQQTIQCGNAMGEILQFTVFASMCGLPQISLPLSATGGCPLGVSVMGAQHSDMALLAYALQILDEQM